MNNLTNIFQNRCRCFSAILISTLLLLTMFGSNFVTSESEPSVDLTLDYTFDFEKPSLTTKGLSDSTFTKLSIPGCMSLGRDVGSPSLPTTFFKFLLPPGYDLVNVKVNTIAVNLDTKDINLQDNPIIPYQAPVSFGTPMDETFDFRNDIYNSNTPYPEVIFKKQGIDFSKGYKIATLGINPLQYTPATGKIVYFSSVTIHLDLAFTSELNSLYRNKAIDEAWVKNLVQNPEITTDYESFYSSKSSLDYPGGICDPNDNYDYVIITTEQNGLDYWDTDSSIPYNWDSLMNKHETEDGLSCTLVTMEEINAEPDYGNSDPLFDDTPAHIREFCKDAYQDWGTTYVLIGGDDEWIPRREMDYDYESNCDSDLYWSNLDKTFNDDGDNDWGEEGDTGFDLYSEIFIGSLTCDEPQDVSNWMTKSFYYDEATSNDYFDNAAFYGGNTGWNTEGDDFIDYSAINGTDDWLGPQPGAHGPYPDWAGFQYGFETWNIKNPELPFDLTSMWTAEPTNPGWQGGSESAAINGFKNDINNDEVTLISGIAHANAAMSLDVGSSSWESDYHNTKPFFIHDYGCHCGDMDAADDGVLHSMLFSSDTKLAFGCVYHTSYGWGSQDDTNSSSALQQKLFWDYLFDTENNSGGTRSWQLGKAHAWSKDEMAPTINWTYSGAPGSWRGTIEACLLFADPAQSIGFKILGFNPTSTHFGIMLPNETASKTFEIWNDGAGTMSYQIIENCSWLSLDTTMGTSSGQHDTITITANTTGIEPGAYHHQIQINSDGGDDVFDVYLMMPSGTEKVEVDQSLFNRGFPIRHAIDGDWAGAQSFQSEKDYLTRARLYLRKFGSPTFDLTIELRKNGVDGELIETLVFTPDQVPSSWDWFVVDFDNINVTDDDYFIVIPSAPSGVSNSFGYEWGYTFGNQYDDGSFWFTRDGGNLWRDLPATYEFTFQTYGV